MASFLATSPTTGNLQEIQDCWVALPDPNGISGLPSVSFSLTNETNNLVIINMKSLPEISDSKMAQYSDLPIQGRSANIKSYSYSSNRTISFTMHLFVTEPADIARNLSIIRLVSSLTHPEYNGTYLPPRIARIKCGRLLSDDELGVPVVLKNYDLQYDNSVQWFWSDEARTYMPLHVSIPMQFDVVYSWQSLPGADDVIQGKY